jgi:hypothetical protein
MKDKPFLFGTLFHLEKYEWIGFLLESCSLVGNCILFLEFFCFSSYNEISPLSMCGFIIIYAHWFLFGLFVEL